jgi:hypothetical protein
MNKNSWDSSTNPHKYSHGHSTADLTPNQMIEEMINPSRLQDINHEVRLKDEKEPDVKQFVAKSLTKTKKS